MDRRRWKRHRTPPGRKITGKQQGEQILAEAWVPLINEQDGNRILRPVTKNVNGHKF
ncbi:hypothetical protein [Serratia entomophila]|uniref:hypothetical protein n=1 Tax=Serratia entomophila TaxID=42906 RepID=UPI0021BA4B66|nr:hypothetical protein [Serratia entomophila]